ncbi:MAG: type II secretion system F family protein [Mesorhizobium sp.]|nr:type II secretion system F family protein [Mesorhizobium sp.]MCO5164479.1 type II secretion system F family protein [Mesorhizobium sp.]
MLGISMSPLATLALALLLAGGGMAALWPLFAERSARGEIKRRLKVDSGLVEEEKPSTAAQRNREAVRDKALKTAHEFYAKSDPENVARLRLKLIQAGYMEPRAVGWFFLIRFAAFAVFAVAALILSIAYGEASSALNRWVFVIGTGGLAYFVPGFVLSQKIRTKMTEYRNGFPDFMDLMIVCSDAGMSMEAGIERVSRELGPTYPSLSENLRLVSIELRAGRSLDDALKSLGDRLSLDEVRSFATLLQQSKELGTSLSGALRVFSDEMRHKRMSYAEEKAHALPAKMSVPVTVCILPVVMMIAIIPIIVKISTGQ